MQRGTSSSAMADAQSKDFDDITSFLGDYGRFQILMMVLLGIGALPNGYMGALAVFVSDTPEHRCRAPPTLNATPNSSRLGPDSCSRYRVRGNWTEIGNDTEPCVDGWEYSTDTYISTTVTEWDLVCDNAWKVPLSTSLFFVGVLTGSFAGGHLSDRFGRKPVVFFTFFLQGSTALIQAASVSWLMFCILNFLRGIGHNYVVSLVLGTEILRKSARVAYSLVGHSLGYGVGYALLPLLAYFIRSWRMLMVASAIPSLLFIPTWWLIPESPRWLLHKGRVEEAERVIRNAAKMNKVSAPEVIFKAEEYLELKKDKDEDERKYSYMVFMRNPNLRNIVIVGVFLWMSICMIFHGLTLNTSNLNGNIYLNCFISALIDIVAYVANWYLNKCFSRPTFIACTMTFCGVLLVVIRLVPEDMHVMLQVLALGGKIGVACAFCLCFVFYAELMPTMVRNMGLGVTSTAGYFGSILCPHILYLGIYSKVLPFIVFGSLSIVAAGISMLLPDTKNSKLPDLISQTKPIRGCCCQTERAALNSETQVKA